MKTKLLFGITLCLLLSSCVKDFIGSGPKDIKFTEKNYIYEGDLYALFLSDEIEVLDKEIAELKEIIAIGQGNEQTLEDLATAQELISMRNDEQRNIVSLDQVGLRLPAPPPPCPRPQNCDFSGLEFLLTGPKAEKLELIFSNAKGEVIGGGLIEQLNPLSGGQGQINFSNLTIIGEDITVATIQVQVFDTMGEELRNYTLK